MITIHDLGVGSSGLGPANTTTPSAAARTGVHRGAAMSMPRWKLAQIPSGGSHGKPVHPNACDPAVVRPRVLLGLSGGAPILHDRSATPGRQRAMPSR